MDRVCFAVQSIWLLGFLMASLQALAPASCLGAGANAGTSVADGTALLTVDIASKLPTNVKLFGLNDVLGPVMQIPYDSPVLIGAVQSLRVGYLRHPGGTVANYWNMTSGRYATTCSHSSVCNMSAAVNKFPLGTFSPENFVKNLAAATTDGLPVFDLNVLTMGEDSWDMQLDTIAPFCGNRACFVEIGNELYLKKQYSWRFPDADAYMKASESLITKLRQRFHKTKVSVPAGGIGSFLPHSLAKTLGIAETPEQRAFATSWSVTLAKYVHLFDAVTIHDYQSVQHDQQADNDTRTSALATWPEVAYAAAVKHCKNLYGDDIAILITEYNEGLGSVGELDRDGGPHALNMLSHVLAGVQNGASVQCMQYHAFLSVDTVGWDHEAGMVRLADVDATLARVNGVSQLFAHVAAVGALSDSMYSVAVGGGPRTPPSLPEGLRNVSCLQAVAFSNGSVTSLAVINRCSEAVDFSTDDDAGHASLGGMQSALTFTTYSCGPTQAGGWVEMPSAAAAFPWPAPLPSSTPDKATLEPFSFSIIQFSHPQ